jgi:hypothetical protein
MSSRPEDQAPEYRSSGPQTENRTVTTGTRARQGVTGHNVRYVLGFGLAGAIAVLAVIYFVYIGSYLGS